MLQKPDIPDDLIIARSQEEFGLSVSTLTFLPLGDPGTAAFRVIAANGMPYFLKLRKDFDEISVAVLLFLRSQGIQEIIPPIETTSRRGWADFGQYKMILYPFIEGKDGFQAGLTDPHRHTLGAALKAIHSARIPAELARAIPHEDFSPQGRDSLRSWKVLLETKTFDDPTAAKLAGFMKIKWDKITQLIGRSEELALQLQAGPLELALCHTDVHGGNILISKSGSLYLVDWDNPILAPKERDLMFIGGGIDNLWKNEREQAVFYRGYGRTEVDLAALAYYRYERVIQDLAVIGRQLLFTKEGGADRERSFGWFASNFERGNTIEIAQRTDRLLGKSPRRAL
ncbi:MAG TPA: phosphotransferase [Anaerolineales bacterium]|nr:phosphotransferase [Anaerolineales bacterium]